MFLVDLEQHRIIHDDEIKQTMATRQPYGRWLEQTTCCILPICRRPRPWPHPPVTLCWSSSDALAIRPRTSS